MIKRKNTNTGMNANVSLEPNAAASSNNNFSNNIYVQTPYPAEVKTQPFCSAKGSEAPSTFTEREISLDTSYSAKADDIAEEKPHVSTLILETYANILLNQDKALITNLISKNTIIIPYDSLVEIIRVVSNGEVEIQVDEDISCCIAKSSPIKKIEVIKVIKENGEIITDFKYVFNKEYNELVNVYHLNLKYVII